MIKCVDKNNGPHRSLHKKKLTKSIVLIQLIYPENRTLFNFLLPYNYENQKCFFNYDILVILRSANCFSLVLTEVLSWNHDKNTSKVRIVHWGNCRQPSSPELVLLLSFFNLFNRTQSLMRELISFRCH